MPETIVTAPDGKEIHFPEGMSNDDISRAMASAYPDKSSWVYRGGQLMNAVKNGAEGVLDSFGNLPSNVVNLGKAMGGMGAAGLNAVSGGRMGVSAADQGWEGSAFNTHGGIFGTDSPLRDVVAKTGQESGFTDNAKYAPTDLQGRAITFGGNVLGGGGVTPVGLENGVLRAIASGAGRAALPAAGAFAGSEIAHAVAPDSQTAQLIGSLAGGIGGGGLHAAVIPTSADTARTILGQITPDQAAKAKALMSSGRVTAPEAVAYLTGNTAGPKIQRTLEGTQGGANVLGPYMAERTPQNAGDVSNVMDMISPDMGLRDPRTTGTNVVQAAQDAVGSAKQSRTAASSPFYQAAEKDRLPTQTALDTATALGQAAVKAGTQTDIGKALMGLYQKVTPNGRLETRVPVLDNIYKETRDAMALPSDNTNAQLASVVSQVNNQNKVLGNALMQNPNIAQGRQMYQYMSRNTVDPVMNSPVGGLADIGDLAKLSPEAAYKGVSDQLVPPQPTGLMDPANTAYTAAQLKAQAPNALPDFARQHIQAAWDNANKYIRGETPQFSGARFAQAIAGNDQQAANLDALVRASAGDAAADGLKTALDTMKAQSTRLGEGSPTALNIQTMKDLGSGGISTVAKPKAALNDFIAQLRLAKNSGELAKAITSPDGITQLQMISQTRGQKLPEALKYGVRPGIAYRLGQSASDQTGDAIP